MVTLESALAPSGLTIGWRLWQPKAAGEQSITGAAPPTAPPTSKAYNQAGLPWFEHYSDGEAVEGSKRLRGLKSVVEKGKEKGDVPLPENESVSPGKVVHLNPELKKDQVREGRF